MTLRYLTPREGRAQRAALARAIGSGEPRRVILACERVVRAWDGCAWPDDWHRWNVALMDACGALRRAGFDCEILGLEDLADGFRGADDGTCQTFSPGILRKGGV